MEIGDSSPRMFENAKCIRLRIIDLLPLRLQSVAQTPRLCRIESVLSCESRAEHGIV